MQTLRLTAILCLASLAYSQTARYPSAIATTGDLTDLADRAQTTLSAGLTSSATSFTVVSGSKFLAYMILTIDNEQIYVTSIAGNTVNGTRGFNGTAAASHVTGALVSNYFVAYQFKALREEVKAIETALGVDLANVAPPNPLPINKGGTGAQTQPAALAAIFGASQLTVPNGGTGTASVTGILTGQGTGAFAGVTGTQRQQLRVKPNQTGTVYEFADPASIHSADYNFPAQSPGGTLSVGASSVLMLPVPVGLNGSDLNHRVYIQGGVGTAEACTIIGGGAISGLSSGTVIINCAYGHSGAWTIQSATAGIFEAIVAVGSPSKITLPAGSFAIHGPIYVPVGGYVIEGQGRVATTLTIDATYPMTALGAPFILQPGVNRAEFRDFQVNYYQPDSLTYTDYLQYPPTFYGQAAAYVKISRVNTSLAWSSGDFRANGSGMTWSDSMISGFGTGLQMGTAADLGDYFVLDHVGVFAGFTSTANQGTVYMANAVGYRAYKCFLQAYASSSLAKQNWVIDGGGGGAIMTFTASGTDTSNGYVISNYANVNFTNSYFTLSPDNTFFIQATDSNILIDNSSFLASLSSVDPLISITRGGLIFRGNVLSLHTADSTVISAAGTAAIVVADNIFSHVPQTFTRPIISIGPSVQLTLTNNRTTPIFSPDTGTFLQVTGYIYDPVITGNALAQGTAPWAITGASFLVSGLIANNPGYNPVGSSAITVTASPFTYTAGPSPEVIYISGGTVSAIKRGATTVAAASPAQVTIPPFGTVQVTYSVVPTMVKDVQ